MRLKNLPIKENQKRHTFSLRESASDKLERYKAFVESEAGAELS